MHKDWHGSIAIVVGGASGIGQAVVRRLTELGVRVWTLDVNTGEEPSINVDVRSQRDLEAAFAHVFGLEGRIDYLVNTAGVGAVGGMEPGRDEDWLRTLEINVLGAYHAISAALPYLRQSGRGAVVNVGSVVATVGLPGRALYSASKGAVEAMTRACAADYLQDGVRFNTVSPGTTDTPWIGRLLADADDPERALLDLQARQPHGRLVEPGEVAEAIALLLSPRATSINATTVVVDGGLTTLRTPPRPQISAGEKEGGL